MSEVAERAVMTADEVAEFLGLGRRQVYEYAAARTIPCRKVGRRFLFSRRAILAWLDGTPVPKFGTRP